MEYFSYLYLLEVLFSLFIPFFIAELFLYIMNKLRIDLLFKEANTFNIYLYFLENNKRLPEKLHNIMLCNSLSNDFYSIVYLKSLKNK
jgi:hypothetical protein